MFSAPWHLDVDQLEGELVELTMGGRTAVVTPERLFALVSRPASLDPGGLIEVLLHLVFKLLTPATDMTYLGASSNRTRRELDCRFAFPRLGALLTLGVPEDGPIDMLRLGSCSLEFGSEQLTWQGSLPTFLKEYRPFIEQALRGESRVEAEDGAVPVRQARLSSRSRQARARGQDRP